MESKLSEKIINDYCLYKTFIDRIPFYTNNNNIYLLVIDYYTKSEEINRFISFFSKKEILFIQTPISTPIQTININIPKHRKIIKCNYVECIFNI